ncbi:MAG TPA: Rne/Rng family ribonuclease [Desulfomonilia bacterium]
MKKMLINAVHPEEIRVAVVEDGILREIFIESTMKEQIKGNIYRGKISRIEKGLNAVFVEIGRDKNGFLPMHDMNLMFVPDSDPGKSLSSQIKNGMDIPVQVVRDEKSAKGALLTMNISLAGRYMVLLPGQDSSGISRKIEDDEQRNRLKEIVKQLNPPKDTGVIVRTAGMDRSKIELQRDLNYVLKLWKKIEDDYASATSPALIYSEDDVVIRSIRDYFSIDMKEVLIDDEATYKKAVSFMKSVMPRYKNILKLYRDSRPLFTKYELEKQLTGVYSRKVKLKSGGHIVIDPTEALVSIDVNSGQASNGKDMEETALNANLEAAQEIARQLILRDLGGLIVIDFIDMRSKESIKKVEKTLKESLKNDRAHSRLGRISQFGILEMSRERLSPPILEKSHVVCPSCCGHGIVRSDDSSALMALREIHLFLDRNRQQKIRVTLPRDVALSLLNKYRSHLVKLEQDYSAEIMVMDSNAVKPDEVTIEIPGAD